MATYREHKVKTTDEVSDMHTFRMQEDSVLLAEGFEPAEDDLWRKDGLWYGREAALQQTQRAL